jgi:hypothetical protein
MCKPVAFVGDLKPQAGPGLILTQTQELFREAFVMVFGRTHTYLEIEEMLSVFPYSQMLSGDTLVVENIVCFQVLEINHHFCPSFLVGGVAISSLAFRTPNTVLFNHTHHEFYMTRRITSERGNPGICLFSCATVSWCRLTQPQFHFTFEYGVYMSTSYILY